MSSAKTADSSIRRRKGAVKGLPVVRAGIVVGYQSPDIKESGVETDDKSASTVSAFDLPVDATACVNEMCSPSEKPVDHGQLTMTNDEKLAMKGECLAKYSEQPGRDDFNGPTATAQQVHNQICRSGGWGRCSRFNRLVQMRSWLKNQQDTNGCLAIELSLWLSVLSPRPVPATRGLVAA